MVSSLKVVGATWMIPGSFNLHNSHYTADNFAKPDSADEVKYAIYNVLKLEVLERAYKHLSDIASEYKRELKQSSSGELRELLELDETKRKEKKEAEARVQDLERERDSAKRKNAEIEKRLRQLQSSRDLQEQRDRIREDLKSRESELASLVREIRELASRSPSLIANEALVTAMKILDQKRERGEIPSAIRQQFIKDLLDSETCICGRPIKDGDKAHTHLTNLLKRSVSGDLEDKVLTTNVALNQLAKQNLALPKHLKEFMQRKSVITDIIKGLHSELDDVIRQLQGSPLEEIAKLESQHQSFQLDIENCQLEIGKCKSLLDFCTLKIEHSKHSKQRVWRRDRRA